MKIVIQTQHRENYGAHDWNGEGECPQYWKYKGGNTYVLLGVTIVQASTPAWWDATLMHFTSMSESFEEYVLISNLEDDDYDITRSCESWDAPTIVRLVDGQLHCEKVESGNDDNFSAPITGKRQRWIQLNGESRDYCLEYQYNGEYVSYEASCELVRQARAA